jgi:hypothetical protein
MRWLLMLALTLWLLGWAATVLDGPLQLNLADHVDLNLLVRYMCCGAEWLLIAASAGACVVLGRYLRAVGQAAEMCDKTIAGRSSIPATR